MNKIQFFFCTIFLIFTSFIAFTQTPKFCLNAGVTGTGSVTVTLTSASNSYTGSFTYTVASPNQNLNLSNLPAGNDYVVKVSNNTNKNIAFFVCQSPRTCDPTSSRYSACEAIDNPVIDGTTVSINAGVNNFIVASNFKIINNSLNGTTCQSNSGTTANYFTGGIYLSLFSLYNNGLIFQPLNYTDGILYIRNSSCATRSQMHIFVNNVELTNYTINVAVFGLFYVAYPYGAIKAGDVVHVTNDCGDQPSPYRIASDINYFIEVPNGTNYTGNLISPTDSLPPSGRLNTPVEVKQCTVIPVSSHFNANFNFVPFKNNDGSVATTGTYKINGNPITASDLTIFPETPGSGGNITINANGSISSQYDNYFIKNKNAGVANPIYSFEYTHNGIDQSEKTFNINQVGYAFIENSTYRTWKYNYGDHPNSIRNSPTSTSNYKLEFTGSKVIFKVDNNKIDSVIYNVQYSIVGGAGSLSNNQPVDISSPINFIPADTGSYAIQAKFSNGVIIQQKFHVSSNAPAVLPSLATIYSGNQITLTASGCAGTIHWGSANSTITGSLYQVSPLVTTTYRAFCESLTGCQTLGTPITVTVLPPKPTVVSNAASVCAGQSVILTSSGCVGGTYSWTGGITGNSISVTPTTTTVYSVICNNAAGISDPTFVKVTVN